jgi:hypothetical protein
MYSFDLRRGFLLPDRITYLFQVSLQFARRTGDAYRLLYQKQVDELRQSQPRLLELHLWENTDNLRARQSVSC